LLLYPVTYEIPGRNKQMPSHSDLVTRKRPMFAYEQEVRVVDFKDGAPLEQESLGYGLAWDPEKNVESVRVHPEADASFMTTVTAAAETYAPHLKDRVIWSEMNAPPPF